MKDTELGLTTMRRLYKKAGAEKVSESAAIEMANVLEEIGYKIAKGAIDYTIHAGRKTVKDRDIKIAAEKIWIKE